MIVTVDYDSGDGDSDAIFLIKLRYICRDRTRCRVRKTAKGYHVYLYVDADDVELEAYIRAYLLDDVYRMALDLSRYRLGFRLGNVLYNVKSDSEDPDGLSREADADVP